MALPDNLRQRLAHFHLGAPVYSADGRHVGSLHRVVVDQESWDAHQIVVKESVRFNGHVLAFAAGLMTDELIIPMSAIAQVSRERVELSLTSREVRRLPPYLSYHLAPVRATETSEEAVSILLGAPRLRREEEEADKASGDIEIRADESVMLGHDGQRLGRVRDVLFDDGELVGVVIRPEDVLEHDVVIQARFLERSDDAALFVRMTPEDLRHLPPFHPEEQPG
jgi:sporulation protein YlmC with PRC-barrel domain